MRISLIVFILSLIGQNGFALSNRMAQFSIHHCSKLECVTARGNKAFLNYNSRLISASHVTLEIREHGRSRTYTCEDFHADLISDYYVCDNRESKRDSLTVDRDLNVKMY